MRRKKIKQRILYLTIVLLFTPALASGFFSRGEIDDTFTYKDLKIYKNTVRGSIMWTSAASAAMSVVCRY